MASLGTLTLDLVAKVGSFIEPIQRAERQVEESAGRIEENLSSATDGIKEMALAAAGAFSAGALFSRFIEESKSAQAEQAQLAAVLKSTGESAGYSIDQLNDMADSLANVSSFGGGDINQAQTALLAFTGIVGKEFPRAMQSAVDMATRTGTSVVSAAETIGRALDVPSKGMSALSKQGFRFTEEQKKLAEQLEATGRTAEAQGIIFEAVEATYAGAGQAARNTFDGALFALDETIGGLLTSEKGISGLTTAVNGLNDALSSDITKTALEGIVVSAGLLAAVLAGRLTSATVTSTAAGYAKVQQIIAENSSTQLANEIAAQRTSRILHLTQVELANAQAQAARLSGIQRLAFIESTLIPLQNAETAAITANTAAQNANNTSKGLAARAGAGLLALTGGPLGLAVAIASVGAAMYFMRDSTNEASESLSLVGKSAAEARIEFEKLNKVQQAATMAKLRDDIRETEKEVDSKLNDITKAFGTFQLTMSKSDASVGAFSKFNNELRIAAKNGQDLTPILNVMQKKLGVPQEVIDSVLQANGAYGQSTTKLNDLKETQKLLNISQGNVANSANQAANAITGVGNAANKATEALQKYLGQQQSSAWKTQFAATYSEKHSLPTGFGNMVAEAQQANDGKGLTQQQTNDLWKYYQAQQAVTKLDKQRNDSIKAGEKATKDSQKTEDKAADNRKKDYEDLVAQYRTESEAIDDLYKKQGILATSYGTLAEKKALIAKIDAAGAYEQAQARIRKEQEYVGFFEAYNDQAAIIYQRYEWEKELAAKNTKFTEKEQKNIFNALVESQAREVALINNKNAQEILSNKQSYLSQADFMTERYRLEREEIEKTIGKSKELKDALIAASKLKELDERQSIQNAASSLYQDKNVIQMQRNDPNGYAKWNMQNEYDTNSGAMDTAFANQKSAIASDPLASEADKNAQLLEAEKQYLDAKEAMNTEYNERQKEMLIAQASVALSSTESMFSSLTDIAATTAGKQSKAYKAMFTIQKIASIAQSSLAISTGIAQAAALPFPANIGAMASVAAATAGIISDIQGIHMEGFANGGYTGAGGKYETAGLVHKGEVVWSQEDIKRSGGVSNVEAMRKGSTASTGANITINNMAGVQVNAQDDGQGNITIDLIDQRIANMLPNLVAGELGNQNSRTSKALKQNFNVAPKR